MYEKPMVLVNEDLAEGIFAASGDGVAEDTTAGNAVSNEYAFTETKFDDWGAKVQRTYKVTVPDNAESEMTLRAEFSDAVVAVWGFSGGTWALAGDGRSADGVVRNVSGEQELCIQGPPTIGLVKIARIK